MQYTVCVRLGNVIALHGRRHWSPTPRRISPALDVCTVTDQRRRKQRVEPRRDETLARPLRRLNLPSRRYYLQPTLDRLVALSIYTYTRNTRQVQTTTKPSHAMTKARSKYITLVLLWYRSTVHNAFYFHYATQKVINVYLLHKLNTSSGAYTLYTVLLYFIPVNLWCTKWPFLISCCVGIVKIHTLHVESWSKLLNVFKI